MTKTTELLFQCIAIVLVVAIVVLQFFDGLRVPEVRACGIQQTALSTFPESLTIQYGEPMAKRVTELAFRIEPYVEGFFSWHGNTMVFTPETGLSPNTTYRIRHDMLQRIDGVQTTTVEACEVVVPEEHMLLISGEGDSEGQLLRIQPSTGQQEVLTPTSIIATTYVWQRATGMLWFLGIPKDELLAGVPLIEQQRLYYTDLTTKETYQVQDATHRIHFSLATSTHGEGVYVYQAQRDSTGTLTSAGIVHITIDGTSTTFWNQDIANDGFMVTPSGEGIIGTHYRTGELFFASLYDATEEPTTIMAGDEVSRWHPIWNMALITRWKEGIAEIWKWEAGASPVQVLTQATPIHIAALGETQDTLITVEDTVEGFQEVRIRQGDRGVETLYRTENEQQEIQTLEILPNGRTMYITIGQKNTSAPTIGDLPSNLQIIRIDVGTGTRYTLPVSGHTVTWW